MIDAAPLSTNASMFRSRIADPTNFPETCDGGDIGSPAAPSIWLLGLEPGWSAQDTKNDEAGAGTAGDGHAEYSVELQQKMSFNRNAFKLLAALKNEDPENYKSFASKERPFEGGSKGYFKANLFPVPCNNLDEWSDDDRHATGFADKTFYQRWMRETRFPIVRAWIEKCRPKLIICTGVTHLSDFLAVTDTPGVPEPHFVRVNGHPKRVHVASNGIVPIAVIPHLSGGPHSLNSYQAISDTADYVRRALPEVEFG